MIAPSTLVFGRASCCSTTANLHRISRLQKWTRDKRLSFVPPDGRFTLMEYLYTPSAGHQVPIPLLLKPQVKVDEAGGVHTQPLKAPVSH